MASISELFTPKLVTVLRDGYGLQAFRSDLVAGLTVAVVALPLSMAIAIASGATPAHGLYTAIVGGFLVSALGGSRFQIGGPAGAFIVSTAAAVIESLGHKMQKRGIPLIFVGTTHNLRQELFSHDLKPPLVRYEPSLERARSHAMKRVEPA